MKAEILQALHFTENNYSFFSAATDSERFQIMFPDSQIAKSFSQGKTNISYNVNYGITPYLKKKLIYDVRNIPFCFKFDKTTNQQVKMQYDAYLQYWSRNYDEIINTYCGSLFVGHCASDNLVDHVNIFLHDLDLDYNYLVQVGMDGPNVNLSFENKLCLSIKSDYRTTFLGC